MFSRHVQLSKPAHIAISITLVITIRDRSRPPIALLAKGKQVLIVDFVVPLKYHVSIVQSVRNKFEPATHLQNHHVDGDH